MVKKTAWGVTLGVVECPDPVFVTFPDQGVYGWKIEQHGIFALGDSRANCIENFKAAYLAETGTAI